MVRKIGVGFGIVTFLIFISTGLVFAQDIETPKEKQEEILSPEVPAPEAEQLGPETQWVWGEVVSVDVAKNEILLKYRDYETDQEKEATIGVDENTTYENVKSIEEIKPWDNLSIDYIISPETKLIAKNISVEKLESPEILPSEIPPEVTSEEIPPKPEVKP